MSAALEQEASAPRPAPIAHAEEPCPNCGGRLDDRFCAHCGQQRIHPGDLSLKHAWHHVTHEWLHLDGRIFTTLRLLLSRPGQLTLDFIEGRRARHIHPIRLFLFIFFLFFFFAPFNSRLDVGHSMSDAIKRTGSTQLTAQAQKVGKSLDAALDQAAAKTTAVYKPLDLAVIVSNGFFLWLFFKNRRRYLAENLVTGLHLASFNMTTALTLGWLMVVPGTAGLVASVLIVVVSFVYFVFATRRVYGGSWAGLIGKYVALEVIKLVLFVGGLTFVYFRTFFAELKG